MSTHCRRYGPRCGGCSEVIHPNDLVRRARDRVFHLNCFNCFICRKQLNTGDQLYVMHDGAFICKDDYLTGQQLSSGTESNELFRAKLRKKRR